MFARLQATYNDGCTTPGNCEYFLGRVLDELNSLDKASKADPRALNTSRNPSHGSRNCGPSWAKTAPSRTSRNTKTCSPKRGTRSILGCRVTQRTTDEAEAEHGLHELAAFGERRGQCSISTPSGTIGVSV